MLFVTELSNITVNDYDAKKSALYKRVFVLTELAVSGTVCISMAKGIVNPFVF